jgi:hypothetical protein
MMSRKNKASTKRRNKTTSKIITLMHKGKNLSLNNPLKPWKMHSSQTIRTFLSLRNSETKDLAVTFMDLKTQDQTDKMEGTITFSRWKKSSSEEKTSNGSIFGSNRKTLFKDQNPFGCENGSKLKPYTKKQTVLKQFPQNRFSMEPHKLGIAEKISWKISATNSFPFVWMLFKLEVYCLKR